MGAPTSVKKETQTAELSHHPNRCPLRSKWASWHKGMFLMKKEKGVHPQPHSCRRSHASATNIALV